MARNKKWSAVLKFEIVLLALKGETTLNEICKRYEVAPAQIHAWRKQLLEHGAHVFDKTDKASEKAATELERKQSRYKPGYMLLPPISQKTPMNNYNFFDTLTFTHEAFELHSS